MILRKLVNGALRRLVRGGAAEGASDREIGATLIEAASRLRENDIVGTERLCHRVLLLEPSQPDAANLLGLVAMRRRYFALAEEYFRDAVGTNPGFAEYHNNLGGALLELWRAHEAQSCFRRALLVDPHHPLAWGNLLFLLNMLPEVSDDERFREHCTWAASEADPLREGAGTYANDPSPRRRLRLGYVSADFRNHAVGYFIAPLLERHDSRNFLVYCYSNGGSEDEMTVRLRSGVIWRDVQGLADEQAAALVCRDSIDLLVDLSGHTRGGRPLLFARKPAPVQLAFLGYPATTGMRAMDFRITDAYADPPGASEVHYRERLLRLPRSMWCWQPDPTMPETSVLTGQSAHHVTFGSLNSVLKLNAELIRTWASILRAVPGSQILLATIAAGEARSRISDVFAQHGIEAARLRFADRLPIGEFRELFRQVDIALDPFPCNGGTTTCETLWMGVPVVTMAGNEFRSRAGVSLLTNAGLPELVAASVEDYIAKAVALATQPDRLSQLREGLRDRLLRSPLMDIEGFVRDLETAYRSVWREWCDAASAR